MENEKKIQERQDIQTSLNKGKLWVHSASKKNITTIYMSNMILVFYINFKTCFWMIAQSAITELKQEIYLLGKPNVMI